MSNILDQIEKEVVVAGELHTLGQLNVEQTGKMMSKLEVINELVSEFINEGSVLKTIGKNYEDIRYLVKVGTGINNDVLGTLKISKFAELVFALLEVNIDSFLYELAPMLTKFQSQMLKKMSGRQQSENSSNQDTSIAKSKNTQSTNSKPSSKSQLKKEEKN